MVFRGSEYTIDVDADGDIVLTRKRGTGDSRQASHAERLRALNKRNSEFWAERTREEQ